MPRLGGNTSAWCLRGMGCRSSVILNVGQSHLREETIVAHTAEKWLKFILRFNGILAVMAIVAVLMPQSWLVWCVSKVERGLPVGLLVSYLARALSLYAFLAGLLFLTFAKDVKRYKAPIRVMAVWCIFAILAFGLYVSAYLPYLVKQWFFWFIVSDAAYSLVTVTAILVLQSRIENDKSSTDEANKGIQADPRASGR